MPPPLPVDVVALLDLGRLGQTHALEVVAGRCTAAQALGSNACVRRSSTSLVPKTWDDFCRTHLEISETESNRTIHLLDEFGPDYFDLSALTRISPETYRAIAPAVKDGALQLDGEAIALRPENSREVTAAVAARSSLSAGTCASTTGSSNLTSARRAIVAEFEEIARDQALLECRLLFNSALSRARDELVRGCTRERGPGKTGVHSFAR